jgi:hypothetical protein
MKRFVVVGVTAAMLLVVVFGFVSHANADQGRNTQTARMPILPTEPTGLLASSVFKENEAFRVGFATPFAWNGAPSPATYVMCVLVRSRLGENWIDANFYPAIPNVECSKADLKDKAWTGVINLKDAVHIVASSSRP